MALLTLTTILTRGVSVPISQNEDDNQVVKEHGQRRAREPWMQHHHELLYRIKGYEWEAGVDVAGHRAYFLTGPGVLLNQALISYGLAFLMKKGCQSAMASCRRRASRH